ncbi:MULTISPECIES: HlyC/CorC family transporter [Thiorhodovibrio]|uniref:HlyC/CorC family transporter n=1 Tax=Thiorhodovibrio TaxID=61593 RepID=UPI0019123FF8|nr:MULTISPECIES: transporter associated domain-containing protein [Thiorhodovibrio]
MSNDRPRSGSPGDGWRKRLRRLLGGEPRDKDQLLDILRDAERAALLDRDGLSMIEGVLQVSDLRAEDIMIPRAEMVTVRREAPLEEILAVAVESSHSRFPVTGEDKSEVLGILLAKDLLSYCTKTNTRPFNIRDHLRSAIFVPESKRLNVLLKEFRGSRNHMAIVVDEYGAAAGLATIEDVLEQIVGEIEDEHDFDEGAAIFKRGQGEYTVKARTSIEDFNEYFGSTLAGDDVDTIGGLVVHALGKLPVRGERIEIEGFRFTVLRADSRRVHLLSVRVSAAVEQARVDSG